MLICVRWLGLKPWVYDAQLCTHFRISTKGNMRISSNSLVLLLDKSAPLHVMRIPPCMRIIHHLTSSWSMPRILLNLSNMNRRKLFGHHLLQPFIKRECRLGFIMSFYMALNFTKILVRNILFSFGGLNIVYLLFKN